MNEKKQKPIFVLIGPSGAQATVLIRNAVERFDGKLGIIATTITRPPRAEERDPRAPAGRERRFVDDETFDLILREGRAVPRRGYGPAAARTCIESASIAASLAPPVQGAICALSVSEALDLRAAGYAVHPIRIMPIGTVREPEARPEEPDEGDASRTGVDLGTHYVIHLSLSRPNGFQLAASELTLYLRNVLANAAAAYT